MTRNISQRKGNFALPVILMAAAGALAGTLSDAVKKAPPSFESGARTALDPLTMPDNCLPDKGGRA